MGSHRGIGNDLLRLQGQWTMVSGSRDGRPLPETLVKRSERVIDGEETIVRIDGQLLDRSTFVLDTSSTPFTIDCLITAGPGKGHLQRGIFAFTEETVRFCFARPLARRPESFTTAPGDGLTVSEWRKDHKVE
ncbi:MAG: TIGR03067 domain-containing protein [Gemmatimonadales bacterium]